MPQKLEDVVFQKFLISISNHKTIESIKLMTYLMKRKTPVMIQQYYEGYSVPDLQQPACGEEGRSLFNYREAIVRSELEDGMKKVFILHGAVDVDLLSIAPTLDQQTLFVQRRQNTEGSERRPSSDIKEVDQ